MNKLARIMLVVGLSMASFALVSVAVKAYKIHQSNRQAAIDECHGMYLKILNMYAPPEVKGRLWQLVDDMCLDL